MEFQFLAVCRHAERADDVGAMVKGLPWCLLQDSKSWPYDPPLSDQGLVSAEELGLKLRKLLAELEAELHVVVTSPFFRCVQTAVLICKHFGRGTKLLIDNSLGEIYGPCIMGDSEPSKPVRPLSEGVSFCSAHGVETLEVRRLLGKWPAWPESLKQARNRFGNRFVEYLQRGHRVKRNFVLVSHADCVGSALTLIPQAGENIEKVHFGGHFMAFHPSKPLEVTSPTVTLSPLEQLDHAAVTAVRRLHKPEAPARRASEAQEPCVGALEEGGILASDVVQAAVGRGG